MMELDDKIVEPTLFWAHICIPRGCTTRKSSYLLETETVNKIFDVCPKGF